MKSKNENYINFIPGNIYITHFNKKFTKVKCEAGRAAENFCFCGEVIESSDDHFKIGYRSNGWNKINFELFQNTQEPQLNVVL
jgi:hypothetical protein